MTNDGTTVVLRIGSSTATAPGDRLEVRITGATNSTAGAHTFDIRTSSDTPPVTTPSYTLGADTTPPVASITWTLRHHHQQHRDVRVQRE